MGQAFWTGVRLPSSPPVIEQSDLLCFLFFINYDIVIIVYLKMLICRGVIMIKSITGTEKFDSIIAEGETIVMFSAPWCGYCRKIKPVVEKISNEITTPIYIVNTDDNQELAERYSVETIPYITIFKEGKFIDGIIGYGTVGYVQLKEFFSKSLK